MLDSILDARCEEDKHGPAREAGNDQALMVLWAECGTDEAQAAGEAHGRGPSPHKETHEGSPVDAGQTHGHTVNTFILF